MEASLSVYPMLALSHSDIDDVICRHNCGLQGVRRANRWCGGARGVVQGVCVFLLGAVGRFVPAGPD